MGACLCCLRQDEFDEYDCGFHRCFGMLLAFFPSSEEGITHSHSAPPSPSAAVVLLDSIPDSYHAPPMPLPFDADISPRVSRTTGEEGEECTGSPGCFSYGVSSKGVAIITNGKGDSADKKPEGDEKKVSYSKYTVKADLSSIIEDEDVCPTCLEAYDQQDPKINTKCRHHFHLGCILEWMERSNSCPVCGNDMVFSESP